MTADKVKLTKIIFVIDAVTTHLVSQGLRLHYMYLLSRKIDIVLNRYSVRLHSIYIALHYKLFGSPLIPYKTGLHLSRPCLTISF